MASKWRVFLFFLHCCFYKEGVLEWGNLHFLLSFSGEARVEQEDSRFSSHLMYFL